MRIKHRMQQGGESPAVTLKEVSEYLGLTPGTVSVVLNDAPSARTIPATTRERIHDAARKLNYRPNFFARSLRNKRTYTIGVIAEEIGDSYGSMVISGIAEYLQTADYCFLTSVHRHNDELLARYSQLLGQRGVEGIITVDSAIKEPPTLPLVAVAGHAKMKGVINIILDHERAALLALKHLKELSHEKIAFMKGNPLSSDANERWRAICDKAQELEMSVDPELTIQLDIDDSSPQLGYPFAKQLLARNRPFTALFTYNDLSALGAIRAIREQGLRVPQDISVIGFDDIPMAGFNTPSLTTIRQPLIFIGQIAAQTLIGRIEGRETSSSEIVVKPELVIRESTGPASL
jgi:DNA-binding LacI/PurR family transcriptional regulator